MKIKSNENTPLTLKNAFYEALQKKASFKILKITKARASRLRAEADYGKFPSDKTMRKLLENADYEIIQPELWKKKEQ